MSDESKLAVANISSENEAVLQELSMTLDLYEIGRASCRERV